MKTKEFIKKVKKLGFTIEYYKNPFSNIKSNCAYDLITISVNNQVLVKIWTNCQYAISTISDGHSDYLYGYDVEELYKLCFEYANTPVMDREEEKTMNFEELRENVEQWANDKDLLHEENAEKQFMKFIEEVFEFKSEMDILVRYRNYYRENPQKKIPKAEHERITKKAELELGDIIVTLIVLCNQLDIDIVGCLEMAYEKISKRKGKTVNGLFVKEEDL